MKSKRGLSVMVGYVLLVTAAIIMSFVVYSFMKTYVPKNTPECPEDVSLIIKDVTCPDNKMLVTIKNTGLFNIDGYIIKGKGFQGPVELGKIDLYEKGYFYFNEPCKPQEECQNTPPFGSDKQGASGVIISEIEITPIRAQFNAETGKNETTVCGNSIVQKDVEVCTINLDI